MVNLIGALLNTMPLWVLVGVAVFVFGGIVYLLAYVFGISIVMLLVIVAMAAQWFT